MPSKLTQSREYQLLNISATVYSLYRVTGCNDLLSILSSVYSAFFAVIETGVTISDDNNVLSMGKDLTC